MPEVSPFTQALCLLISRTNGTYALGILANFIKAIPIDQDHDVIAESWSARLALGPSLDDKNYGILPALAKKKQEADIKKSESPL